MDNSSWVDILPPVTPGDSASILILSGVSVLFVVSALILYLWRNSAKQQSVRALNNLLRNLPRTGEGKNIPFQISDIFKQSFEVNNIAHITMPGHTAWCNFRNRLIDACFKKDALPQQELEKLLVESRYWLKRRVVKND